MEYATFIFFAVLVAAIVMEAIDSSLGMMYGTILSPLLIGLGFLPMDVVPAILISQALGGVAGSVQHHRFKNADFSWRGDDLKVGAIIFALGIVAVVIGVFLGVKINKFALSLYISILMLVMGIIVFFGFRMRFSWKKISVIGFISAFNKALSGGGFGPIVTSGQLIVGRDSKNSVGATTMSEVEICLASFVVWLLVNNRIPSLPLMVALCGGAVVGGLIGPYVLSKVKNNLLLVRLVGLMAIASGTFALIKIL